MEGQMAQPDFWEDQQKAKSIAKRCENLKKSVNAWDKINEEVSAGLEIAEQSQADIQLEAELKKELNKLEKEYEKLEFLVLFSGKYDQSDAIVSIHAGTGGTEAQDWAEMLLRMLMRFAEKNDFEINLIDKTQGQEAGIKSATIEVTGAYAYGRLKSEAGVHRLVRISPFDAEKMRHTSFALIEVMPVLGESDDFEINEKDLRIDVFRSGGAGGQSVNRTDSAVRITHLPSGIVVKCQNERSQLQNRKTAMKILKSKLAELSQKAKGKELAEIRGEVLEAAWGNQIRSYVLQPYKLVKDHRTEFETSDPDSVLDGELDEFVAAYLKYINQAK